ncbi:hypothetical protein V6N12_069270 [Hibiscus sabdariffa]|uniref:Uncharacterized protein n=1 Tax=Hibiscus sabdariffa TaxID=183260 RepID=A0ABR2FDC2_9ROSI
MSHNNISTLRRADDSGETDPSELKSIALNFYRDLFTLEGNITDAYSTRGQFPHVDNGVLMQLGDMVSELESVLAKVRCWFDSTAKDVHSCVGHVSAVAAGRDMYNTNGNNHVQWNPPPECWEVVPWEIFLSSIEFVARRSKSKDFLKWVGAPSGHYTAKSFYYEVTMEGESIEYI